MRSPTFEFLCRCPDHAIEQDRDQWMTVPGSRRSQKATAAHLISGRGFGMLGYTKGCGRSSRNKHEGIQTATPEVRRFNMSLLAKRAQLWPMIIDPCKSGVWGRAHKWQCSDGKIVVVARMLCIACARGMHDADWCSIS